MLIKITQIILVSFCIPLPHLIPELTTETPKYDIDITTSCKHEKCVKECPQNFTYIAHLVECWYLAPLDSECNRNIDADCARLGGMVNFITPENIDFIQALNGTINLGIKYAWKDNIFLRCDETILLDRRNRVKVYPGLHLEYVGTECPYIQNHHFLTIHCEIRTNICYNINCVRHHCGQYLNETCTHELECSKLVPEAVCSNNLCRCRQGLWDVSKTKCEPQKLPGYACQRDAECTNGWCRDGLCECPEFSYWDGKSTCLKGFHLLGQRCRISRQCVIRNSMCLNYRCVCHQSYYNTANNSCFPKKKFNQACASHGQCLYKNCYKQVCLCRTNEWWTGFNCISRKLLSASCQIDRECLTKLCQGNMCVCNKHQIPLNNSCINKIYMDVACEREHDPSCLNGTICDTEFRFCKCPPTTYLMGDNCIQKLALNQTCKFNVQCLSEFCLESSCQCPPGTWTYANNNLLQQTCRLTKHIGQYCERDEECNTLVKWTLCVNQRCTCDNLTQSAGQICISPPETAIFRDLCAQTYEIYFNVDPLINHLNSFSNGSLTQKMILDALFVKLENLMNQFYGPEFLQYLNITMVRDGGYRVAMKTGNMDYKLLYQPMDLLISNVMQEPEITYFNYGTDIYVTQIELLHQENCAFIVTRNIILTAIISLFLISFLTLSAYGAYKLYDGRRINKLIPWKCKVSRKKVQIPEIKKTMIHTLRTYGWSSPQILGQKEISFLSPRHAVVREYLNYFYHQYYDFDFAYLYDMSFPYEEAILGRLYRQAPGIAFSKLYKKSEDYSNYYTDNYEYDKHL